MLGHAEGTPDKFEGTSFEFIEFANTCHVEVHSIRTRFKHASFWLDAKMGGRLRLTHGAQILVRPLSYRKGVL